MVNNFLKAAAVCTTMCISGAAIASPLPAVTDSYVGNYDIADAFSTHGLWLPGFLGDHTWSVDSGTANYDGTSMVMTGSASNNVGGTTYSVDFNFTVFETALEPSAPYCGRPACTLISPVQEDNIVYFDMGSRSSMGTITGSGALSGLVMDVAMRPLDFPSEYKPGQLGFGGNWVNLEFGYSNWMFWEVISNTSGVTTGTSNNGDLNFDFLANGTPVTNNPPPVPLPAGLPLLLAGMGALALMRRRNAA